MDLEFAESVTIRALCGRDLSITVRPFSSSEARLLTLFFFSLDHQAPGPCLPPLREARGLEWFDNGHEQ
jgi:hypothetical protein